MSYKENFIEGILSLSEWGDWSMAKTEWNYVSSDMIPDSQCLCGHPIVEVCTIHNRLNNNYAEVGNCCVKKFMDNRAMSMRAESDFTILKGLQRNPLYTIKNVSYFHDIKVITDWDYTFYQSLGNKRNLSYKQEKQKLRINNLIVASIKNKKIL